MEIFSSISQKPSMAAQCINKVKTSKHVCPYSDPFNSQINRSYSCVAGTTVSLNIPVHCLSKMWFHSVPAVQRRIGGSTPSPQSSHSLLVVLTF